MLIVSLSALQKILKQDSKQKVYNGLQGYWELAPLEDLHL